MQNCYIPSITHVQMFRFRFTDIIFRHPINKENYPIQKYFYHMRYRRNIVQCKGDDLYIEELDILVNRVNDICWIERYAATRWNKQKELANLYPTCMKQCNSLLGMLFGKVGRLLRNSSFFLPLKLVYIIKVIKKSVKRLISNYNCRKAWY